MLYLSEIRRAPTFPCPRPVRLDLGRPLVLQDLCQPKSFLFYGIMRPQGPTVLDMCPTLSKHSRLTTPLAWLFLQAFCCVLAPALVARPIVLEDPENDGYGPGTYFCPTAQGLGPGSFDLKRVVIEPQADHVEFTVTFAKAIEWFEARFERDGPGVKVFLPVIDIYIRSPHGGNQTEVLPGRRISPGLAWTKGVVISAVPDLLGSHYSAVAKSITRDLCFARSVRVIGAKITATVPKRCIPSDLDGSAFLVLVTGLGPGAGLRDLVLEKGPDTRDPFVLGVEEQPGQCGSWEARSCWCGGCKPCGYHPFVFDAIVPRNASQESLLGSYSERQGRFAVLPFVSANGGEAKDMAQPIEQTHGPRFDVIALRGRHLTIKAEQSQYPPGTIGAIICPGEVPGGTAVVQGQAGEFLLLEKSDDQPTCHGALVEF